MYLIDTNICIYSIKGQNASLNQHLLTISPDDIFVSSVAVGELFYGAAKSRWGNRTRETLNAFLANFHILPFDEKDAILFGKIRADLESAGTPIGAYDLMIAAQGISRGLMVVTHNVREFSRVPGISLEDWMVG